MREVTYETFKKLLQTQTAIVVNVLPKPTFDDAHIPNTINLPIEKIPTLAPTLLPDLDAEIVLYCGGFD